MSVKLATRCCNTFVKKGLWTYKLSVPSSLPPPSLSLSPPLPLSVPAFLLSPSLLLSAYGAKCFLWSSSLLPWSLLYIPWLIAAIEKWNPNLSKDLDVNVKEGFTLARTAVNRKVKFSKLFFFFKREKKKRETARVERCFALKRKEEKKNTICFWLLLRNAFKFWKRYFHMTWKVTQQRRLLLWMLFCCFFFPHGCFFLCPFVFSRKVCEVMHPKKGHVYVHFSPTSIRHSMFLVFKYLFLPSWYLKEHK